MPTGSGHCSMPPVNRDSRRVSAWSTGERGRSLAQTDERVSRLGLVSRLVRLLGTERPRCPSLAGTPSLPSAMSPSACDGGFVGPCSPWSSGVGSGPATGSATFLPAAVPQRVHFCSFATSWAAARDVFLASSRPLLVKLVSFGAGEPSSVLVLKNATALPDTPTMVLKRRRGLPSAGGCQRRLRDGSRRLRPGDWLAATVSAVSDIRICLSPCDLALAPGRPRRLLSQLHHGRLPPAWRIWLLHTPVGLGHAGLGSWASLDLGAFVWIRKTTQGAMTVTHIRGLRGRSEGRDAQ